ncbi:MAG: MlaD family protein [Gemmatimonadota bacterium]|nr:MCE family protein [Gemmatimonadota bacterium]
MRRKEVLVGLVIVLATAVAVGGTLFLKGASLRRNMTPMQALLFEAGQLAPGNSVKFRGVAIGRVEEIRVAPSGRAVAVDLLVQRDVNLPQDAAVVVSPESLFGDWQVEIVSRADFPSYDFLVVDGSQALPGHTLPDLSRLTATADEIAENLTVLTDRVELAFTEETARNLARAIDNIGSVSDELNRLVTQQARSVEQLTAEVAETAAEVGAASQEAGATFARVNRMLDSGAADSTLGDARETLAALRSASTRLDATLAQVDSTLAVGASALGRFERIGASIESGEGTLGLLLSNNELAVRAEAVLTQLDLLLADFRENPQRYVRLSIF